MIDCNCPHCGEPVRIPERALREDSFCDDAFCDDAQAECPWCGEVYPVSQILDQLPPLLIMVPHGSDVPDDSDRNLQSDRRPAIEVIHPEPDRAAKFRSHDAAAENVIGATQYGREDDLGTPVAETFEQPAPRQMVDGEGGFENNSRLFRENPPMVAEPLPEQRFRRRRTPIRAWIGVALGGLAAIPLAAAVLAALGRTPDWGFWPFDGGNQPLQRRVRPADSGSSVRRVESVLAAERSVSPRDVTQTSGQVPKGSDQDSEDQDSEFDEANDSETNRRQLTYRSLGTRVLGSPDRETIAADPPRGSERWPEPPLELPDRLDTDEPDTDEPDTGNSDTREPRPDKPRPDKPGHDADVLDADVPDADGLEIGNRAVGNRDADRIESGNRDAGEFDAGEFDAGEFDAGTTDTLHSDTPDSDAPTNSSERVELVAATERATARLKALDTLPADDESDRLQQLLRTYVRIARVCEMADLESPSLRDLATTLSGSDSLDEIAKMTTEWLNYSKRTPGIVAVGKLQRGFHGYSITLDSGEVLAFSESDPELSLGRVLVLGITADEGLLKPLVVLPLR